MLNIILACLWTGIAVYTVFRKTPIAKCEFVGALVVIIIDHVCDVWGRLL